MAVASPLANLVPLSRENLIQVVRGSMKFLRADHQIDIRQQVEQRLPAALRHATHKPEDHAGTMAAHLRGETLHLADCFLLCRIPHAAGIEQHHVSTILDVGANIGQYSIDVFKHGFKGQIYSFEPIPSVYMELSNTAKKYSMWEVFNLGVGRKEEEIMINVSENFVSSSILKVEEASLSAEPTTRITHQEKVKLTTIDSFVDSHPQLKGEILLKLDVQGYELEALGGALKSLKKIKLIQAELSFTKLYENGPLYDEVAGFLKGQGYEVFTIMPGFRDEETGRMLQADGLFIRK